MKKMFVAAILASLGGAALLAAEGALEDTNWVAVELMGKVVTKAEGRPAVHIQLHSVDKKLTGFSGCNSVFGAYDASHEGLKFDPVGATRVACLDPHVEPEFLQALTSTVAYRVPTNSLELLDKDGKVIGKFQAAGPAEPVAAKGR
jgi:heat shock protein HslJ